MKKWKLRVIAAAMIVGLAAHAASADVVAGWDFSQYMVRGFLTLDGQVFDDTLDANYSNLDPTLNLGPDSGQFGKLLFDGSMGSDDVDETSRTPAFYPTGADPWDRSQLRQGPIVSNQRAPVQEFGDNRFDSFAALRSAGQQFTRRFAMRARAPVNVVFSADSGVPLRGWELSFGARSARGNSLIRVEHDIGCTGAFTNHASSPINLSGEDTAYSLSLSEDSSQLACVRLGLTPGSGEPVIDNVALQVPEPGSLLLHGGSLLCLGFLGRRRPRPVATAARKAPRGS